MSDRQQTCVGGDNTLRMQMFVSQVVTCLYLKKGSVSSKRISSSIVVVDRVIIIWMGTERGTAIAQWLRCCSTNRKVAGSIPVGVSGIFIDINSCRSHHGPGVDSASNRNEYQEYFLGVKAAGA